MFNKVKTWIQENSEPKPVFDALQFDDPVAMQTMWTPAKPGGSNFKTHKLAVVDHHRLEFNATMGAKLFCSIFFLAGLGVLVLELTVGFSDPAQDGVMAGLFVYLFGLLFMGVGAGVYYYMCIPRVFDKWAGLYWKGYKEPRNTFGTTMPKDSARLGDIHAIQLLSEYIRSDKSSYYSYELNIVLRNGERLNVVDHGSKARVLEDSRKLSEFLGKPVWDAT
jgi:hypothetical protein